MSDTVIEKRRRSATLAGVDYELQPMPLESFGDVSRAIGDVLGAMVTSDGEINVSALLVHGDELRTALKAGVRVEDTEGKPMRLDGAIIDSLDTSDTLALTAAFITLNEDFFSLLLRPTMSAMQEESPPDGTSSSQSLSDTAN